MLSYVQSPARQSHGISWYFITDACSKSIHFLNGPISAPMLIAVKKSDTIFRTFCAVVYYTLGCIPQIWTRSHIGSNYLCIKQDGIWYQKLWEQNSMIIIECILCITQDHVLEPCFSLIGSSLLESVHKAGRNSVSEALRTEIHDNYRMHDTCIAHLVLYLVTVCVMLDHICTASTSLLIYCIHYVCVFITHIPWQ